jgi:two-component system, cell cycle sensor histidine kinase and response regulator CckA
MSENTASKDDQIKADHQEYSDILMHAPIGVFTSTPEGRFVSANHAMARMLGYASPEELLSSVKDIARQHYADSADREFMMQALNEHGEVNNQEFRMIRTDGTVFWVSRSARVVRDSAGRIIQCQGFVTDITKRKLAEESGRKSQERFKALVENLPVMVNAITEQGRFTYWNKACETITGYAREEIIDNPAAMALLYPDPAFRRQLAREWEQAGKVYHDKEIPLRTKDGSVRHIVWSNLPPELTHAGHDFWAVGIDITKSKMIENELRTSEQLYRTLFEGSRDGFVMVDVHGRITDANQAFCEMLGYSLDELRSMNDFYAVTPARWRTWEAEEIWQKRLLGRGYSGIYEKEYIRKDGTVFPVELQSYAVFDDQGNVEYLWGVARDITKRKQAEAESEKLQAQLLQAQKMESIGILAGGVAHDFNNLLQVVRGNVELLMHGKADVHPDAIRLNSISRSLDRATRLIRQLLVFSRKAGSRRIKVNLNQVVRETLQILERTIPKMIALELRLDPATLPLFADPVQIEQILLNLASNSVDAMPEGGRLIIETGNATLDDSFVRTHPGSSPGCHVRLTVTDTGAGMNREAQAHVFDPFFTTKEVGKGTGLGLAMVYGIVKSHGGYTQCYSEPGLGTTFTIYLPAVECGIPPENDKPEKTPPRGGNETILVVDDEPDIRELTRESLEMLGYGVQCVANGEDALQAYQAHGSSIDLVLLDLNMPGMGGYKCLKELLRIDPEVKVVIASGYTANNQGKHALSAGARGFIGKPYLFKDLAAGVRKALDNIE